MTVELKNIKVEGLAELNRRLQELPRHIAKNTLRGAVNAAATVIRKEAQQRAPVYIPVAVAWGGKAGSIGTKHPPAGTLKRAIYQKHVRAGSDTQQMYIIGVRHSRVSKVQAYGPLDAYYWHFVEFGTSRMAARPFLRPAFALKKDAAIDAMKAYLAERIPREAAKL